MSTRTLSSVAEIDPGAWDGLDHGPSPFLRHGFLAALEASGSVGAEAGWEPAYVVAERAGALVGVAPAFVKTDSYGEYIFDWAWAQAAGRAGIRYYPKVVVAAPFTPVTGPRLLLAPGAGDDVAGELVAAVGELAAARRCSSVHWLFCTEAEGQVLEAAGLARRASYQFHWQNRGYATWDDFLAALKSRKRKQIRKERERAREAIDGIDWVPGGDLGRDDLDDLDRFYRSTVYAHGGFDYLRPGFFEAVARAMPDTFYFARARKAGRTIAGAIFFDTGDALYGRYWGCDAEVELLHFEVAYYAGIERAIARGIPLFEAGAQGEHKLLRGFQPAPTHSAHAMAHPGFDAAVRAFLADEAVAVERRMEHLAVYGPYRED